MFNIIGWQDSEKGSVHFMSDTRICETLQLYGMAIYGTSLIRDSGEVECLILTRGIYSKEEKECYLSSTYIGTKK